jgi:hypothetical protein
MNNFKVGFVDFFGILCPGILLMLNLQILIFAFNINSIQYLKFISNVNNDTFSAIILFVMCYLFGAILRLISPDYVDKTASFFLKIINPGCFFEKKKFLKEHKGNEMEINEYFHQLIDEGKDLPEFLWYEENYPYYLGNKNIYNKYLSPGIANIMNDEKYHNKHNYNFWKVRITHKDMNIASLVFQAEAFVRFMAGSFWALLLGVISSIVLVVRDPNSQKDLGMVFTIVYVSLILIILSKFKNQRHREVKMLLDAIIVSNEI